MNNLNDRSQNINQKPDKFFENTDLENCKAIILAGGSGLAENISFPGKLRRLRPTYFCRTGGSDFAINNTRKLINNVFSERQTYFLVSEEHERYYGEVLNDVWPEHLIVQPQNNGTTMSVLYAVLKIAKNDPSAVLAFFPPDLETANEVEFMRRVEAACKFARRDPHLILLGITPEAAAAGNELIELDPSACVDKNIDIWRVRRFSTNATAEQAQQLFYEGALIHSAVMIGTAATFLRKIRRAAPEIYERFSFAAERMGIPSEQRAVRAAFYSQYPFTDFSRDVLEKSSGKLMVVPVPAPLKNRIGLKEPADLFSLSNKISGSAPKYFTAHPRA
ncbi:MAG: hypothetical protein R2681_07860 [Pyrinomonadaceae bacterium]